MIFVPVLSLEQLQGGIAQSVNGRLKNMNGLAASGNGEGVVLVAAGQLPFVVTNGSPDIAIAGIAVFVIAQKYGTVVFPGFKEQVVFQTVADNNVMDAAAFQIADHGVRVAVPLREQQLF